MKEVLIFGGTGFIGKSLAAHLVEKGFHPVLLARHAPLKGLPFEFVSWDAVTVGAWADRLEGAGAIVNLAGKTVDCIKTPSNCDLILRSRVDATKVIGEALKQVQNPPKVWVQMSTAHIYGDPPDQLCTERSTTGYGLAPFVGRAWEKTFAQALPESMRGVVLRTSFVIGKKGGALSSLKRLTRLGLGGRVGRGSQGISWIHEWDMNELIYQAIKEDRYSGTYIASAPHPVSQRDFMSTLRRSMGIPVGLPAPAFLTRLGAQLLFNTDPALILYGRFVKSERLEEEGYTFKYPTLEEALVDLVR